MHRVELKGCLAEATSMPLLAVPNAPCGVERDPFHHVIEERDYGS